MIKKRVSECLNNLVKEEISNEVKDSSVEPFFCSPRVKHCKNQALKVRFDTLITRAGFSHSEFYGKAGISRQYYYFISWGIWDCPMELKVKIARILSTDSCLIWQEEKE